MRLSHVCLDALLFVLRPIDAVWSVSWIRVPDLQPEAPQPQVAKELIAEAKVHWGFDLL